MNVNDFEELSVGSFDKRPGTTDKGKNYEDCLTALLALKLTISTKVEDFELSSNDKRFGDFDDIVLKILYENQPAKQYAIQLKHKQNLASITRDKLAAVEGPFSIQKYFNSYKNIKSNNDLDQTFYCVLYTCGVFEKDSSFNFTLKNEDNVKLLATREDLEEGFFNTSEKNYVYKFKTQQDVDDQDYNKFFQDFVFYPNQKTVEEVAILTSELFQKTYSCDETAFNKYIHFIKQWSEQDGRKEFLNKKRIKFTIGELLLKPYLRASLALTTDSRLQLFREACYQYDVIILETKEGNIKKTFCENVDKPTFERGLNVIELTDDQDTEIYAAISLILESVTSIKFLLIGERINKEKFQGVKVFHNLRDLHQKLNIYQKVMNELKVSVQGRDTVVLSTIVGKEADMETNFTTQELVQILTSSFKIGENEEDLPAPYITQHLLRTVINLNYLNNIRGSTICVVSSGNNLEKLKNRLFARRISLIDYLKQDDSKHFGTLFNASYDNFVIIAEDQCSLEDFQLICQKNPSNFCHHFRLQSDGNLEWIASTGGVQDLINYRLPPVSINESEMINPSNKVNIICSQSGMGKSVMLKYLKNNFPSTYWVLYIKLQEHVAFFQTSRDPELMMAHILEHQSKVYNYNDFENNVRKRFVSKMKLIILWDGLDELSNLEVIQEIVNAVGAISRQGFICWITARHNLSELLSSKLSVFPLEIEVLKEEKQKLYIEEVLRPHYTEDKIRIVVQRIVSLLEVTRATDLLGMPLQLNILTELLRSNPRKYYKLIDNTFILTDMMRYFVKEKINFCYDKNNAKTSQFLRQVLKEHRKYKFQQYEIKALQTYLCQEDFNSLPPMASLSIQKITKDDFEIITNVVGKNFSFFHNSFGEYFAARWISRNFRIISNLQNFFFKEDYKNIRRMFDIIMCKNCPVHLAVLYRNFKDIRNYNNQDFKLKDKIGRSPLHLACAYGQTHHVLFLRKNNDEYVIDFDKGETVAEENTDYKEIVSFLLNKYNVLQNDTFLNWNCINYAVSTLSLFPIDAILKKCEEPYCLIQGVYDSATLIFYSVKFDYKNIFHATEDPKPYFEDEHGSNLLHQIPQWNRSHFLPEIFKNHKYVKLLNQKNCIKRPLLICCGIQIKGTHTNNTEIDIQETSDGCRVLSVMRETPLHFASLFGDDKTAQLFIDHGADVNLVNNNFYPPLHYAVSTTQTTTAKLLIRNGAVLNMNNVDGNNELHFAVLAGSLEMVRFLVQEGTFIIFNKEKFSPLTTAIMLNRREITEVLLNSKNFYGNTVDAHKYDALTAAASANNVELLQCILNQKVHIRISTCNNRTALHVAVLNNNLEMIKLLINHNFNIDVSAIDGFTALHMACSCGLYDIVRLLVEKGANVDKKDETGCTPMHYSTLTGNVEIIKFLLQHGAAIDSQNNLGGTPLYFAAYYQNLDAIEILKEYGAKFDMEDKYGLSPRKIMWLNRYVSTSQEHKKFNEDRNKSSRAEFGIKYPADPWTRMMQKGCFYVQHIPYENCS